MTIEKAEELSELLSLLKRTEQHLETIDKSKNFVLNYEDKSGIHYSHNFTDADLLDYRLSVIKRIDKLRHRIAFFK